MWNSYVLPLRQDYYAELPDCVFAAAVRKEADAAALREYRAAHAERKRERALRLEIRQLEALKIECERNPLYFDNAEEQEMELAHIEMELSELKQKCKPIVESKKSWSSVV
jgi:ABC-type phosphate transport system auxiliary subunit